MSITSQWSPFNFKGVPPPLHNINSSLVNVTNSNDPRGFGSNETNRQWGLSGVSNNAEAAAASALQSGGSRKRGTRRNKNLFTHYKKGMVMSRRRKGKGKGGRMMSMKQLKKRFSSMFRRKTRGKKSRRGGAIEMGPYGQLGGQLGYAQYNSDVANTATYSLGGPLNPMLSALANPPVYQAFSDCRDNYNHYTGKSTA